MNTTSIRKYRKRNKISQLELAKLSLIPQTTISGWEEGLADHHAILRAIRLAHILGVTVEQLFAEEK